MTDASDVAVADNPARHRYEARCDDELAGFVDYRLRSGSIVLTHTEVFPQFEGRGVGGRLAAHALDDARARGLAVVPQCPFIGEYIRDHPDYADLVAAS